VATTDSCEEARIGLVARADSRLVEESGSRVQNAVGRSSEIESHGPPSHAKIVCLNRPQSCKIGTSSWHGKNLRRRVCADLGRNCPAIPIKWLADGFASSNPTYPARQSTEQNVNPLETARYRGHFGMRDPTGTARLRSAYRAEALRPIIS
jgi:hypothetical protein